MIHCTFDTIEWISGRKAPPLPYPITHQYHWSIFFTSGSKFDLHQGSSFKHFEAHLLCAYCANILCSSYWFILSSSSILSAPPCIVNDNDRYKMKAPLILVYFLWKRKPRTQIWKNPRFLRVYRAIMRGAFVLLDIRMMFWTLFTLINTCRHASQHLKLILRWKNQKRPSYFHKNVPDSKLFL